MKSLIPFERGIFYQLEKGHAVTGVDVAPGPFSLGTEFKLNNMLQMFELKRDGQSVGYWFYTGFRIINKGGVLVCYLETKRGKATKGSCVIRQPEVVVYQIDGCGFLIISPLVNPHFNSILAEQ